MKGWRYCQSCEEHKPSKQFTCHDRRCDTCFKKWGYHARRGPIELEGVAYYATVPIDPMPDRYLQGRLELAG